MILTFSTLEIYQWPHEGIIVLILSSEKESKSFENKEIGDYHQRLKKG